MWLQKKTFTFFSKFTLETLSLTQFVCSKTIECDKSAKIRLIDQTPPPSTVTAQQIAGLPTWFRHRTIGPVPKRKASVDRRTPEKDAAGSGGWAWEKWCKILHREIKQKMGYIKYATHILIILWGQKLRKPVVFHFWRTKWYAVDGSLWTSGMGW